jgi:hypothetical protein
MLGTSTHNMFEAIGLHPPNLFGTSEIHGSKRIDGFLTELKA